MSFMNLYTVVDNGLPDLDFFLNSLKHLGRSNEKELFKLSTKPTSCT